MKRGTTDTVHRTMVGTKCKLDWRLEVRLYCRGSEKNAATIIGATMLVGDIIKCQLYVQSM